MKTQSLTSGLLACSLVFLFSCKKDDNKDTQPALGATSKTVVNLDADAANKNSFTLYNLAESKVVPNSDSATTKWDIGFKATTIIINGGSSGPGGTVAQVISGAYNQLSQAPEAGYTTDATAKKAITGWYSYNMNTHVISPVAGSIIVVKTTGGKYVKMEITSYYKDAPASPDQTSLSRHYNFRYVYQADGSRNFN